MNRRPKALPKRRTPEEAAANVVANAKRRATEKASVEWVRDEVLTPQVREAIERLLRSTIIGGQETHRLLRDSLDKALATVDTKGVYGGQLVDITDRVVRAAVLAEVVRTWGDDAMAPMLADVTASGKYVY